MAPICSCAFQTCFEKLFFKLKEQKKKCSCVFLKEIKIKIRVFDEFKKNKNIFQKTKNKILVWIIVLKNDFCKKFANSIYIILIKFNSS